MGYTLLGLLWFIDEIVQKCDLVTRFVSVPIASLRKHRVKFRLKLLLTSQHLNESLHILRNIPGIMARSTFCDVRLTMDEIEGGIGTRLGISTFCAHSFIPSKATSSQIPTGFVEIVIIVTHIDIDVLVQVAIRSTEQQVIDTLCLLHEIFLGNIPANRE